MPKIIENVRNNILSVARRQLMESGYSHMTMRSVAAESGIAVGTLYNYFESKDVLTAHFVLCDWFKTLKTMEEICARADNIHGVLSFIRSQLNEFIIIYTPLFSDKAAVRGFAPSVLRYHAQLRSQLAAIIAANCERLGLNVPALLPSLAADALLTWTSERCDSEELEELLLRLF